MSKKTAPDAITDADLQLYLSTSSDFAFELSTLKALNDLGLQCFHSGTYEDPVTGKARQFDIQAMSLIKNEQRHRVVMYFAVECKNIRPNAPLVIHCVPRAADEAFIDVVWSERNTEPYAALAPRYGEAVRLREECSPYPVNGLVGKASDQVTRRNGEIVGSDQEIFDKISQSLNSAYELLQRAHYLSKNTGGVSLTVVVPVLVVPVGRLWVVEYDSLGGVSRGPATSSHISYFTHRRWVVTGSKLEGDTTYSLSHLEICDLSALSQVIQRLTSDDRLNFDTIAAERSRNRQRPGAASMAAG